MNSRAYVMFVCPVTGYDIAVILLLTVSIAGMSRSILNSANIFLILFDKSFFPQPGHGIPD